MQKTILITGGTGYIGSHAVVIFEQAGYKCVIVDNLVNSSTNTINGIEKILGYRPDFFELDLREKDKLEEIFKKYDFDGVIHFAGLKAFGESTTYPYMYFENNISGTMILLDVMDRFGVHDIVFSSSASVYDESNTPPFTENMKLGTTNPYATSKLVIENILKDYSKQKGFRSAVLRYFNLIGAHSSGNLGDFPRSNHGSLASNIFDVVFGKKQKLYIYGDDFPTPDGTAIRDYIDVCDLVEGHVSAFNHISKQDMGFWDVWNLGTGSGLSVKELIGVVEEITGEPLETETIARRNIDLAIPISNPEKASIELGWKAKVPTIESMKNAYNFLLNTRKKNESTKKERVIHFVPYFEPHSGGLEMYAKEWAENYVKLGGKSLIATFSGGQKEGNRTENGYDIVVLPAFDIVHSFPFPMFWMPSFWIGLWKIRKWKADVIHTHTRFFLSSFIGGIFAKISGIPWIHIEHGSGFVVSSSKLIEKISKWYDYSLGKWTLKNALEIITVSEACEHFVYSEFGVKKTRTIYRGITPTPTTVIPSDKEINIGYVGRLVSLKGVDFLLNAFADFMQKYKGEKEIKLNIVGDGPDRKKLEKLSETLGISKNVIFHGIIPVTKVREEFLPSLHIFVNPSLQEGLPTTVIEALISGASVIATDVGGTREILRYAQFILVAPRSTRALSNGLEQSVSALSSKTSSKIPVSLFAWEQTFREFSEVYNLIK